MRIERVSRCVLLFATMVFTASLADAGLAFLPPFSPSDFQPGAAINNPYFPLVPGTTFHSGGTVTDPDSGEKAFERSEDVVTRQTQNLGGVKARVVHARTWQDSVLIEDTLDFYAQDKKGNVWYLGEATKAFEYDDDGKLISTSTEGSWRTGVHGAKPGFIMPAHPTLGFHYYQEFSPKDGAVDEARITGLNASIIVPAGDFHPALKTLETTATEPGVKENKFYGLGAGIVLTEEDVDPSGKPLNSIPLLRITTAAAVPLPPAAMLGLVGLLLAFAAGNIVTTARRRASRR